MPSATQATVWPQLERVLPQRAQACALRGGEGNAVVKDHAATTSALAAVLPGRLRGRAAQPGHPDPLRGAQRARGHRGGARVRALARHGGGDAGGGDPLLLAWRRTGRRALFDVVAFSLACRGRVHQPAGLPGPGGHPAARGRPRRRRSAGADRRPRGVQPRAAGAVRRRGLRGRRRGVRARGRRRHQARPPRGAGSAPRCSTRSARSAAPTCPTRYAPEYLDPKHGEPHGRLRGHLPAACRRPVPRAQAHRLRPRRLAVPQGPAGPADRGRARALQRRDLPRLHARLPLLPGRDDHPAGARAQPRDHQVHGRPGRREHRLRGGRAAEPVLRGPLRHPRAVR